MTPTACPAPHSPLARSVPVHRLSLHRVSERAAFAKQKQWLQVALKHRWLKVMWVGMTLCAGLEGTLCAGSALLPPAAMGLDGRIQGFGHRGHGSHDGSALSRLLASHMRAERLARKHMHSRKAAGRHTQGAACTAAPKD